MDNANIENDTNENNQNHNKITQLLIVLTEKQEAYRNATEDDKVTLQTEIDGLQSDLHFLEQGQAKGTSVQRDRVQQLNVIQLEARHLFQRKNSDYGDAFATYGPVGVLVRIGDKIQRLQSIHKRGITLVQDEKMRDTLIDLHNYAAMAIMLIDEK
tara:strand:- start:6296 stop:6763 length:468 start_codon:yes stop_codon:yes gene_type:complete